MRPIRYLCIAVMLAIIPIHALAQQSSSFYQYQNPWTPANTGIDTLSVWSLLYFVDSIDEAFLVAGTDAGVFLSTDAGESWASTGLDTSNVSNFVFFNDDLYAATYEDGIFFLDDAQSSWTPVNNGLENLRVGDLVVDQNGVFIANTVLGAVYRSTDAGTTWEASIDSGLNNPFVPSLAVDDNNAIFAGTDDGVLRSFDDGTTWEFVNNGLGNLHVESLLLGREVLFAGTDAGLYRTFDEGENWEDAHTDTFSEANVRALVANSNNAIFAGTHDEGVFRSLDNGTSWDPLNDGLTNLDIASMAITPEGTMFAGTVGGGVFRRDAATDVSNELESVVPNEYQLAGNYPNPFAGTTTIRFALPEPAEIKLTLYDITGRALSVLASGSKQAGWHEIAFDASDLPSGVYFYDLRAGDFAAVDRLVLTK